MEAFISVLDFKSKYQSGTRTKQFGWLATAGELNEAIIEWIKENLVNFVGLCETKSSTVLIMILIVQ